MAYNPQFPYTFKVQRPAMDENGEPDFAADGSVQYTDITLGVVQYSRTNTPIRENGTFVTVDATEFSYGYRTQGMNAVVNGDAIITEYKIATPMLIGEVRTGDRLCLTDNDRVFYGTVVTKRNTNFGTNIWFNEVKN